jgi:hypothetical protein
MRLNKQLEWLPMFFKDREDEISGIRPAGGCRELWVQGEIYLYLEDDEVFTNATPKKFDLYKEDNFIIELKFLGGNYQPKVLGLLNKDFEKLVNYKGRELKYVLLILDTENSQAKLYKELFNFKHPKARCCFRRLYDGFYAILWKVA